MIFWWTVRTGLIKLWPQSPDSLARKAFWGLAQRRDGRGAASSEIAAGLPFTSSHLVPGRNPNSQVADELPGSGSGIVVDSLGGVLDGQRRAGARSQRNGAARLRRG